MTKPPLTACSPGRQPASDTRNPGPDARVPTGSSSRAQAQLVPLVLVRPENRPDLEVRARLADRACQQRQWGQPDRSVPWGLEQSRKRREDLVRQSGRSDRSDPVDPAHLEHPVPLACRSVRSPLVRPADRDRPGHPWSLRSGCTGRPLSTRVAFCPWVPVAPRGPCCPGGPGSPVSPFGPTGPSSPVGPTGPRRPGAPAGPEGPVGPCAPVGPLAPVTRCPGWPWMPWGPVGPVTPMGP